MQVKSTVGGWGDGLVHKVFAMEARGPEFTSPAPMEKTRTKAKCGGRYSIIPALGQAERQVLNYPSAGAGRETGRFLGLTSQAAPSNPLVPQR